LFGIGSGELFFILFIALLLFGPQKLPQISRTLGKIMADLRRTTDEIKRDIMESESVKEIKEAAEQVKEEIEKNALLEEEIYPEEEIDTELKEEKVKKEDEREDEKEAENKPNYSPYP
jgi:sec-independent protein translocase protein TatA